MQVAIPLEHQAIPGEYWQWRGHRIYYVKAGQKRNDRPPLLLVHGFGASTDHWRKNIVELQADFEVWAIDLLGFGRSQKANVQYSGDLWRDQLHDFITEMIAQPVVLAGNSLGGYASLCVAAQRPQAAVGLILLNSAGPFSEVGDPVKTNILQTAIAKITRFVFLQSWGSFLLFQYLRRPQIIRRTLEKVYVDKNAVSDRLVAEIYQPSCDPGALQVFASVFKSPQGEKNDVLLSQLQHPLLMIWGEGDPWMKVRDRAPKFRQYYPNLTEHFLQAGHCPHDEVPQQVNQIMRDWTMNIKPQKYRESRKNEESDRNEMIQRDILSGRKFSLAEAIGREGGSFLKGESPVPKLAQAVAQLQMFVKQNLSDSSGALQAVLYVAIETDSRVSQHLDSPLVALEEILSSLLENQNLFYDFVNRVDRKWGQIFDERPHFQQPGQPPHPEDEYTHESVRSQLTELLKIIRLHQNP